MLHMLKTHFGTSGHRDLRLPRGCGTSGLGRSLPTVRDVPSSYASGTSLTDRSIGFSSSNMTTGIIDCVQYVRLQRRVRRYFGIFCMGTTRVSESVCRTVINICKSWMSSTAMTLAMVAPYYRRLLCLRLRLHPTFDSCSKLCSPGGISHAGGAGGLLVSQ